MRMIKSENNFKKIVQRFYVITKCYSHKSFIILMSIIIITKKKKL